MHLYQMAWYREVHSSPKTYETSRISILNCNSTRLLRGKLGSRVSFSHRPNLEKYHIHVLTHEERHQIQALMKVGHNQAEIAAVLRRDKSTISQEIHRNSGLCDYRHKQTYRLSIERC